MGHYFSFIVIFDLLQLWNPNQKPETTIILRFESTIDPYFHFMQIFLEFFNNIILTQLLIFPLLTHYNINIIKCNVHWKRAIYAARPRPQVPPENPSFSLLPPGCTPSPCPCQPCGCSTSLTPLLPQPLFLLLASLLIALLL